MQDLLQRVAAAELPVAVEGVHGGFAALLLHWLREQAAGPLLVVTPTEQEADLLVGDLRLFGGQPDAGQDAAAATAEAPAAVARAGAASTDTAAPGSAPDDRVRRFPWWGLLPYSNVAPVPAVFGERAGVLAELVTSPDAVDVVVTSLRALLTPVPPADYLAGRVLELAVGRDLDPIAVEEQLVSFGYVRVPRVSIHGEFSVKGEVFDVYPYGREHAVRAVLEFDTVEELREFEPATQRSVATMQRAAVYPAREVHVAGSSSRCWRRTWRRHACRRSRASCSWRRCGATPMRAVPSCSFPCVSLSRRRCSRSCPPAHSWCWPVRSGWQPPSRRCARSTTSCTGRRPPRVISGRCRRRSCSTTGAWYATARGA